MRPDLERGRGRRRAVHGGATTTLMLLSLLLCVANPARAGWLTGPAQADVPGERDWGIELVPYGWLAGVTGEVGIQDPTQPATTAAIIEFGSITDTLNGAFASTFELRWRRWRLIADGFWSRFEDSSELSGGFDEGTWSASLAFGSAGVAYELPIDIGPAVDLTAAARWWRLGWSVSMVPATPPGGPTVDADDTVLWADAVFGLRVRQHVAEHWHVWARGDVGGGAARVDWSLEAGMGWDANRHVGLIAAYRLLGVKFSGKGYLYDMTHTGLLVGLRMAY